MPGRMTGGGSTFNGNSIQALSATFDNLNRITHGFEIHCSVPPPGVDNNGSDNNNLEINWGGPGDKHKFHLDKHLTFSHCDYVSIFQSPNPPAANFNWFHGRGTGSYDNVKAPATIDFIFTDSGEPGGTNGTNPPDTAAYCISSGTADLTNLSSCDRLRSVSEGIFYQFDNGIDSNVQTVNFPFGIPLTFGNHQAHNQ
jgi:hypothetical protein